MFKKQKGYIGAIGDDLPSLIPLFLGIVLFFAVFINTYNVYTQNTSLYSSQNEALRIALILKEEPVIISHDFYNNLCNKVDTTYKWTAFLVDVDLNSSNNRSLSIATLKQEFENDDLGITEQSISYEQLPGEDPKQFLCGDYEDFLNLSTSRTPVNVINYMFPITRQQEVNTIPVKLYVVVWEGQ